MRASIFGTKSGRKFPVFGVSAGGAAGWRLQVSPGKRALEILKGDDLKSSVPLDWKSEGWTRLRLVVRTAAGLTTVEGKAWAAGAAEPAEPMIRAKDASPATAGRAGLWGSPYAGTPIRFDDLAVGEP